MTNFVFDWTGADIDGANTLGSGADSITVTVATPQNAACQSAELVSKSVWNGEALAIGKVSQPVVANIVFSDPVTDLRFDLFDVDAVPCKWDDKVTILARDAGGNLVPVSFTGTHHTITATTVEGGGAASQAVNGPGAADTVRVVIPGPIMSLEIRFDNGGSAEVTGTIGLSDLSFSASPAPALRDGVVEGTGGGDLIDDAYLGDPQGDRIDAGDSLQNFNDTPFTSDVPSSFVKLPGGPVLGNDRDAILAGGGNDTVFADSGDDVVYGGSGDDILFGGSGEDVLVGENGRDALFGGDGRDRLFGGNDSDALDGGAGDDRLFGGNAGDRLDGGTGNDQLYGEEGEDTLFGGEGDDTLIGANGQDQLRADAGDDLLDGGEGDDTLDGGAGNDSLTGANGQDSLIGGADNDTLDGGFGDDRLFGDAGADQILGDKGNDFAEGGAGNDTLTGGQGDDRLFGGDDRDVFYGDKGDQIYGGSGGDDFDRLVLGGLGPIRIVDRVVDSDGNGFDGRVELLDDKGNVKGSFTFENIEIIPCFTPGTLIATPRGEVPVELLREGDRVITRDNGLQEVRWIGRKDLTWQTLGANAHLRPILIRQGSLGNDLPERDMLVSPNHRMLVANERTALYFDEHEVLVAAKHLVNHRDIKTVSSLGATYIHFMFDRHEVVLANGAWTESFQPGDYTLKGMGNSQRQEILELFPELRTEAGRTGYSAARRTLKRHEALLLNR